MNATVLPRFLIGSRRAILEVSSTRSALAFGVLFALSAGFAREYDGEDLLHEPWHIARPLAVSLVSGSILFLLVHVAVRHRYGPGSPPRFVEAYRSFMAVFWWTAPMAWLYAIPYERFLSPVDAIGLNLLTLALVAGWRVVLITRAISVLYDVNKRHVFFLVMLFADVAVFAAATFAPRPVLDVMGGVRHSARDALVSDITLVLIVLSVFSAPVWLLGAAISAVLVQPSWRREWTQKAASTTPGLRAIAAASIIIWIPALLVAQPEQINRYEASRLLRSGRIGEALGEMSRVGQSGYPPHWEPPPRPAWGERAPRLTEVVHAMRVDWPADWIAELYLDKVGRQLRQDLFLIPYSTSWEQIAETMENHWTDYHEASDAIVVYTNFLLDYDVLTESERMALERILIVVDRSRIDVP